MKAKKKRLKMCTEVCGTVQTDAKKSYASNGTGRKSYKTIDSAFWQDYNRSLKIG